MKEYNYITGTVATKVSAVPVIIKSLVIEPRDTKKGSVTLYDGTSASDPKILVFRTLSGETKEWNFGEGLKTKRGLYVGSFVDANDVLIQYTTKTD